MKKEQKYIEKYRAKQNLYSDWRASWSEQARKLRDRI